MPHPLLLEINTRCWLRELSDKFARPITLAGVPKEEIASWEKRGFTHIWLMGAWTAGQKSGELARAQPNLQALAAEAYGVRGGENLVSSPYAVADYTVAPSLGGPLALLDFRAKLRHHDLGLVLDFVPNHLGLDHPWLTEKGGLFVQSAEQHPETFPVAHEGSTRWIAHGKDPYFPAWTDTAQLDYRLPAARAAMTETLQSIASLCDGVRCDMAMLPLNDIFSKTWSHFPPAAPAAPGEFWSQAISAVKQRHPQFLFIAEAYWDLEPRLQSLGFDYAYDKKFLDYLTQRNYGALQQHIRSVSGQFHPVRFLENHDEPRIASLLSLPEQKAAAVLLLAQPGMRLVHDGQDLGKQRRTPVQFARYWPEGANPEISAFYDQLLTLLPQTAIGSGEMEFCETGQSHYFAMKWRNEAGQFSLAAVNLAPYPASFQIPLPAPRGNLTRIFSDPDSAFNWKDGGLHIDLAAYGFELLVSPKGQAKEAFPPGSLLKYMTPERDKEKEAILAGCVKGPE